MTTLGDMKAEIASDLFRDDMTAIIGQKITAAIRFYNRQRFYFNTLDSADFSMVVGQSRYTVTDAAFIPNIAQIDALFLVRDDATDELGRVNPEVMERRLGGSPANGRPCNFAYENRSMRFAAPPDDTYTVRVHGLIYVDGPAADDETDNPWMTEGYGLIKARATSMVYGEAMHDPQMAQNHSNLEGAELANLIGETNLRSGTGEIEATDF